MAEDETEVAAVEEMIDVLEVEVADAIVNQEVKEDLLILETELKDAAADDRMITEVKDALTTEAIKNITILEEIDDQSLVALDLIDQDDLADAIK